MSSKKGGNSLENKIKMDILNLTTARHHACKSGSCYENSFKPPPGAPPQQCGTCPPCPASCNAGAALQSASEKEAAKLTYKMRQTEENYRAKVTECAILRAESVKRKEELEKEKCARKEVENKLRQLEMKMELLATHTNMMLGTKEQALEHEISVATLKQCYKEARQEIEDLRLLLHETEEQMETYKTKFMNAQQLIDEQKKQMDLMDMDNMRISEQINLEIQRVKLRFQEKLQELAPLPDLLKATQNKLKDSQQTQAIAEHNAENLAKELHSCRERLHILMHSVTKPTDKADAKTNFDDKQIQLLNQKISQLTETNNASKNEIEKLKQMILKLEDTLMATDKRLNEKMHECAQLGGELDRTRDDAARALQRANERTSIVKSCLQTTIAEFEMQLASSRAQVATLEKERQEIQARMQCQINYLNENFEHAQLRVLGLQEQVITLRKGNESNDDAGEMDPNQCACKSFFE